MTKPSKKRMRIIYRLAALVALFGLGGACISIIFDDAAFAAFNGCVVGTCSMLGYFAFGSAALMPDDDGGEG